MRPSGYDNVKNPSRDTLLSACHSKSNGVARWDRRQLGVERRCYSLSSQQQTALDRGLEQARKIRMRLGGGVDLLEPFPQKPKGMHRRTFQRLRARAEAAVFGRRI